MVSTLYKNMYYEGKPKYVPFLFMRLSATGLGLDGRSRMNKRIAEGCLYS